jgi:glycosyltransferase involved in cell wall biosynthesis
VIGEHICGLTSVHFRRDTRILLKECASLARAGHRVTLVVADGLPGETVHGVEIRSVPKSSGRLARMAFAPWHVFRAARRLKADCYHLHDPELIPAGLLLRLLGARVIYDAHEDLPKQLRSKPYLPTWATRPMAGAARLFLRTALPWFSGVVAATPAIARSLGFLRIPLVAVNNYPMAGELDAGVERENASPSRVCYVGAIARIRGVREMIQALRSLPTEVHLILAGPFEDAALEQECRAFPEWARVEYRGAVGRNEVRAILGQSLAGLVPFHPAPNHMEAQPNKLFEYMSAGLPVIASDFPLWRELLGNGAFGLCVDPLDPEAIARAIAMLRGDPGRADAMGRRGREAVETRFSWEHEVAGLFKLYEQCGVR